MPLPERVRAAGRRLREELGFYRLVLKDPRTPGPARVLLGLAVGYALLPFDLIPDFIPVVGHLDDMVLVPALAALALRLVPAGVVEDCRKRVRQGVNAPEG